MGAILSSVTLRSASTIQLASCKTVVNNMYIDSCGIGTVSPADIGHDTAQHVLLLLAYS